MNEVIELAAAGLPAMLCLVSISAFCSASETALLYLSREELRGMKLGNSRERAAAALLANPDRLMTAILFWNLVTNLTYFAVSFVITQRLASRGMGGYAGLFGIVSVGAIILFGEVLPKSVAVVFARRLATLVSWPVAVAVRLLDPITPVLVRITLITHRTFWPHVEKEPYLHADDLERAVEATKLSEDVIRQERQVLHNILDLSEITAEEVMRPRGTYVTLSPPIHLAHLQGKSPPGDFVAVQENGSDEFDEVVPLASASALPTKHLEAVAQEIEYVPWCAKLADILQLLRENDAYVVGVVNEYGETIGVITYEDVLDNILQLEASRARRLLHREPVLEVEPGKFQVEGITTLRHLCKRLGIDYEPASDALITVAGMLHEQLEDLPAVGDECIWQGYKVQVVDVSKRGQPRVLLWKESADGE